MTTRFFMLQSHYRSTLDFSNEALQAAEKGYQRLMSTCQILEKMVYEGDDNNYDIAQTKEIDQLVEQAFAHLNDDFGTPQTIARLFDLSKKINAYNEQKLSIDDLNSHSFNNMKTSFFALTYDILGLKDETLGGGGNDNLVEGLMDLILDIRKSARTSKDWDTSDQIRNVLNTLNITVKDGKEGSSWSVS